jgi:hypothetical protein
MIADTIARRKITLHDVEPAVLHRIEVPFEIRLDRLHLVVQAATTGKPSFLGGSFIAGLITLDMMLGN